MSNPKIVEYGKKTRYKPGNQISSKYKEEYAQMIIDYFRQKIDEGRYPTFELFADSIDVCEQTIQDWRAKHSGFGVAYTRCLTMQKGILISGGVEDRFNANIVKFVAENNFGMREKVETNQSIQVKVSLPDELEDYAQ